MKTSVITLLLFGMTSLGLFPDNLALAEVEVPSAYVSQFDSPDTEFFSAVLKGLENYRDTRQFKGEWQISADKDLGVIETNWYPEHKGEVRLKVQVAVWGKRFRVDVWQKFGWLVQSAKKTDPTRRIERQIQEYIETTTQQNRLSEK